MKKFFAYQKSEEFFKMVKKISLPKYASDQLKRAAFSIPLNLSEGFARFSPKDKLRFYRFAFASAKECKSILELQGFDNDKLYSLCDFLCAILYKLIKNPGGLSLIADTRLLFPN